MGGVPGGETTSIRGGSDADADAGAVKAAKRIEKRNSSRLVIGFVPRRGSERSRIGILPFKKDVYVF